MSTLSTKETDQNYIIGTYHRQNLVLTHGQGARCWDENEKEYIDFGAGIGVNSLGYTDPDWCNAVCEQVRTLQHASNLYYTRPDGELAEILCKKTSCQKVLFCNSGAEANECAIKLARKYSFDKYGAQAERNLILTLQNSFHGRTITTLAATGQEVFHNYFFPFTQGFTYAPANDIGQVRAKLSTNVCAVMLELVQGEGGVIPLEKEFVKELSELCQERDILLIVDEVQTGMGRTGTLLASEQYGIKPNITTLAKGLGGGLPIGAVLTDEKTCDVFHYGDHGTTFGGNPVVCAGAIAVLNKISDEIFLKDVQKKGFWLKEALLSLEGVLAVDGLGLMLGITLKDWNAAELAAKCIEKGLIPLTAKNKLRLLPPLTITQKELQDGVSILKELLSNPPKGEKTV